MDSKAGKILSFLSREYPDAKTALRHKNPFQLLVATILSAQCTDERVNKVTPALFKKYLCPQTFASADIKELEQDIRSTGFYRNKAKSIKESSSAIIKNFGGKVPKTMKELLTLRGVARKTANVVLGDAYKVAEGIAVDTHVKRLAFRLGLSKNTNPEKIEKDLMGIFDKKDWIWISHALIYHGRKICKAQNPQCPLCGLNKICPYSTLSLRV
ncbi:MAG: endonuclease III [Elusimicrobia bacterium]|nr:endonuclease III [Elusimicrobiota bacterium]